MNVFNMKKISFAVILFTIFGFSLTAAAGQKNQEPDTYNYRRGVEAFQNNKNQEALDYFNKKSAKILVTDMPIITLPFYTLAIMITARPSWQLTVH